MEPRMLEIYGFSDHLNSRHPPPLWWAAGGKRTGYSCWPPPSARCGHKMVALGSTGPSNGSSFSSAGQCAIVIMGGCADSPKSEIRNPTRREQYGGPGSKRIV